MTTQATTQPGATLKVLAGKSTTRLESETDKQRPDRGYHPYPEQLPQNTCEQRPFEKWSTCLRSDFDRVEGVAHQHIAHATAHSRHQGHPKRYCRCTLSTTAHNRLSSSVLCATSNHCV